MCTELPPPGVNPTAVNKYIISYYAGTSYIQLLYNLPRHFTGEHCISLKIAQLYMESVGPVPVTSSQHLLLRRDTASVRSRRRAMAQAVGWPMAVLGGRLAPVHVPFVVHEAAPGQLTFQQRSLLIHQSSGPHQVKQGKAIPLQAWTGP
jgi:hypothetical protein